MHRDLHVAHEVLDLRFRVRRKMLRGVKLTHGPAEIPEAVETIARTVVAAADCMHAAFPTRLLFGLPGERLVAHLEKRVGKRLREIRRGVIDNVERVPCLQRLDWRAREDRRDLGERALLLDDNAIGRAQSAFAQERTPRELRRESFELSN